MQRLTVIVALVLSTLGCIHASLSTIEQNSYGATFLWRTQGGLKSTEQQTFPLFSYQEVDFEQDFRGALKYFDKSMAANQTLGLVVLIGSQIEVRDLAKSENQALFAPLKQALSSSQERYTHPYIAIQNQELQLLDQIVRQAEGFRKFSGKAYDINQVCDDENSKEISESIKNQIKESEESQESPISVVCLPDSVQKQMEVIEEMNSLGSEYPLIFTLVVKNQASENIREEILDVQGDVGIMRQMLYYANSTPVNDSDINYQYCDELCQTQVKFIEGWFLVMILCVTILAGLGFMNVLDVPQKFLKPQTTTQ